MELRNRKIGSAEDGATSPGSTAATPMRRARRRQSSTSSLSTLAPAPQPDDDTEPESRPAASSTMAPPQRLRLRVTLAWLVHLYTATGVLVNFYALLHAFILDADFHLFAKLNWLAIFIDATDGTMARTIDVKKMTPGYDGAMLDNLIDFLTFTILPALTIIRFALVPGELLQWALASSVLISSAYAFCQTAAKVPEAFVGFPSYWNIVVMYIYYLECSPAVTTAIVLACSVISFVPIHFIYPTKTRAYMGLTLGGAYIWGAMMLLPCFFPDSPYIKPVLNVSLVYVAYYFGMSLHLDRLRRKHEASATT